MADTSDLRLSTVAETLLIPLYNRAMESQRPDALLKDEIAMELVKQERLDFSRVKQIKMNDFLNTLRILFTREFDLYAYDFISRNPHGLVVHIGCGLDSRFERVDNGQIEWFDLDLPEVITLRRKFIGGERDRYHLLAHSVLEDDWLEVVKKYSAHPCLFLAETVFVYFNAWQMKSFVLRLRDHFPGAELVLDGWKPFEIWLGNRYFAHTKSVFTGLMRWGVWNAHAIEGWDNANQTGGTRPISRDIHLIDEWGFFDRPEPRLARYGWMAPFFRLLKPMCIYHFQLGDANA